MLDIVFYPDASRYWDDERFVAEIRSHLEPTFHVLDYGAGRGKNNLLDLRELVTYVAGADVDEEVLQNPHIHERKVIFPGCPLDFQDDQFDLIFSCNVLEHIGDPEPVFSEIRRVLKPGGLFISKTTNKNHYVALIARVTPLWFHKRFNRLRGREDVDTFPTTYKCNSRKQIERLASDTELDVDRIIFWEWRPEYLRINPLTYLAGIIYEKIVNINPLLEGFRAVMVVRLRKPR